MNKDFILVIFNVSISNSSIFQLVSTLYMGDRKVRKNNVTIGILQILWKFFNEIVPSHTEAIQTKKLHLHQVSVRKLTTNKENCYREGNYYKPG